MYNRIRNLPIRSHRIFIGVFMLLAITALAACGSDDLTATPPSTAFEDQELGPRIAVALVGTGEAYESTTPDIDGDGEADQATCFDVDLVDVSTGNVIGDAVDCLSNITPDGDGRQVVGTTTFNIPQGQLVARGLTTAQPLLHDANGFTHSTGTHRPLTAKATS